MLSILLLYFIGKKFADLADKFKKEKWRYVVLGIVTFYGGAILLGMIFFLILELLGFINLETLSDRILGYLLLPFGFLSCYLLYTYFDKKWEKEKPKTDTMIDEIGYGNDL